MPAGTLTNLVLNLGDFTRDGSEGVFDELQRMSDAIVSSTSPHLYLLKLFGIVASEQDLVNLLSRHASTPRVLRVGKCKCR